MKVRFPKNILCSEAIISLMLFLTSGATFHVYAQSDLILTQYWTVPTLYNPADAGNTDMLRIRGAGRLQWVGMSDAPKSFAAAADMPFKISGNRIGAGILVKQDTRGLLSGLLAGAQVNYRFNMKQGSLGIGLQAAYYHGKFKGSEVQLPEENDNPETTLPALPTQDVAGKTIDFSIGAAYSSKIFHAGVSILHLTAPTVKMTKEKSESTDSQLYETHLPRTLYFETDGNIELQNSLFILQPSLIAATDFDFWTAEATMRAIYKSFLSLGIGYRWKDAVTFMIGAEYKNFFLGYAYDYPVSAVSRSSSGSHEIVAGYSLKIDLSGKQKHRQRSIRLM